MLGDCVLSMQEQSYTHWTFSPLIALIYAVMVHAFGKLLIAADAKTAAALATQHNLASVTLGGEISRPGSLQGGWHGGRPCTQTASAMLEVSRVQVCSAHLIRGSWQYITLSHQLHWCA